jgi:hypothetical protein
MVERTDGGEKTADEMVPAEYHCVAHRVICDHRCCSQARIVAWRTASHNASSEASDG